MKDDINKIGNRLQEEIAKLERALEDMSDPSVATMARLRTLYESGIMDPEESLVKLEQMSDEERVERLRTLLPLEQAMEKAWREE
jgi:hypothetical protein